MGTVYTIPVLTGVTNDNWGVEAPYAPWQQNDINIISASGLSMFVRYDSLYGDVSSYGSIGADTANISMACWRETTASGADVVRMLFKADSSFHLYYAAWSSERGSWFYLPYNNDTQTYVVLSDPPGGTFFGGTTNLDLYADENEARDALFPVNRYPITYYPTNVTLNPAPSEAAVDTVVTVGVQVPPGYTIRDPSSNIVVRNNGVIVPHTWDGSTSQFTFVMPDPS